MVTSSRPWRAANASRSGRRAMPRPSSVTTSHSTPAGCQAGQAGQVDGRLGVAGPLEHAALAGPQHVEVTGPGQVVGPGVGVDQGPGRQRPVRRPRSPSSCPCGSRR